MINISTKDWEIKNVDTVLFDKDGTFVDLHYFWGKMTELRVQEVIRRYSLSSSLLFDLSLCLGFDITKQRMLSDGITALYSRVKVIELFTKDLKKLGITAPPEELAQIFDDVSKEFYKNITKYIKPIENAINLLHILKSNNIKLGLITADSIESTQLTLKYLNLQNIFDVVFARESCSDTKESGIPALFALKDLNSSPFNTIMIGDTPSDSLCAKNANIEKTILVATGQMTKELLMKSSQYSIDDLSELSVTNSFTLLN